MFRDDDRMANVYDVRGATAEWAWRSHTNIFHSLCIIELHTHNKSLKADAVGRGIFAAVHLVTLMSESGLLTGPCNEGRQ